MIIDVHVHIIKPEDTENLLFWARRSGVEQVWASSLGRTWTYEPSAEHCRQANDDILRAMEMFGDAVVGMCYVNPAHGREAVDEIQRCHDKGMRGIKLWVARKADHPDVFPIYEKAIDLKMPILQHSWYKITGNLPNESTPENVARAAARYPEAKIIMAHIGGNRKRAIYDVAPYPNVYLDTSGGLPEAEIIETALREVGAKRIVYGSDAPGRCFAVQMGKVLGPDMPSADRESILWKNAARLIGAT